jgi:hypothetical protein
VSRLRRLLALAIVAPFAVAGFALAYWTAHGTGTASAAAATFTAPSGVQGTTSIGSSSVSVSWTAGALSSGTAPQGYYVVRKNTSTNTTSPACGSSATSPVSGTSCSDTSVASGTYTYAVTAVYHSWTAVSAASGPVTVQGDATPPTSSATSPAATKASSFTVSYTASDNPGGRGLAKVELYVKTPTDSSFSKAATNSNPSGSGTFDYTPAAGPGSYAFYTRATDQAGNTETTSAAQTTTVYDTTAPSSSVSGPQYANGSNIAVTYTAADSGGSGPAKVELWMRKGTSGAYSLAATDSSPGASGTLTANTGATGSANDGSYQFYSVAYDKAGNVEAAPASQDATVVRDTVAPSGGSITYTDGYRTTASVTFTLQDGTDAGSGIATKAVQRRTATLSATDGTCGPYGSFAALASNASPDGTVTSGNCYQYQYVVTDAAGNATTYTSTSTAKVDTVAPAIQSVSAFQSNGTTTGNGLMEAGDKLVVVFNKAITGLSTANVTVTESKNFSQSQNSVMLLITGLTTASDTGSSSYIASQQSGTRSYSCTGGTGVLSADGKTYTVTLGSSCSGQASPAASSGALKLAPDTTVKDFAGATPPTFTTAAAFKLF